MRNSHRLWLLGLIALVLGSPARAATSLEGGGIWSLERSDGGIRALTGLRFEGLDAERASAHFGVSLFGGGGTGTHLGNAGLILDLGAGYAAPLGENGRLVPSLAFTALGTVGEGGGGVDFGLMAGLGAVAVPEHGVGARADATLRWLSRGLGGGGASSSPSEFVLALTVGLVWPGQQR
jgi:hypothetical protein